MPFAQSNSIPDSTTSPNSSGVPGSTTSRSLPASAATGYPVRQQERPGSALHVLWGGETGSIRIPSDVRRVVIDVPSPGPGEERRLRMYSRFSATTVPHTRTVSELMDLVSFDDGPILSDRRLEHLQSALTRNMSSAEEALWRDAQPIGGLTSASPVPSTHLVDSRKVGGIWDKAIVAKPKRPPRAEEVPIEPFAPSNMNMAVYRGHVAGGSARVAGNAGGSAGAIGSGAPLTSYQT